MMITVYSYDENGIFSGEILLVDASVLPPRTTVVAPIFQDGKTPIFINGGWIYHTSASTANDLFQANKAQKLQALKAWHDSQIEAMKAKYSQAEIDSFLDKRNEAMAWRVNNTAATPYVDAMSGGDATVRLGLINAILAKVDATAQIEALVLSKRDAIELSTIQAELDAIVW